MRLYTQITVQMVLRKSASVFAILMTVAIIIGIADWLRAFDDSVAIGFILAISAVTIPQLLAFMLPVCLLVGVSHQLYVTVRDNEVVALSISGLSPWQHAKPYVLIAFASGLILLLLSEFIFAPAYRAQQRLTERVKSTTDADKIIKSGEFIAVGNDMFVFAKDVNADGQIEGLTIAKPAPFVSPANASAEANAPEITADQETDAQEQTQIPEGAEELFFYVQNGRVSQRDAGVSISGNQTTLSYRNQSVEQLTNMARARIDLAINLSLPEDIIVPIPFLPVRDLLDYSQQSQRQQEQPFIWQNPGSRLSLPAPKVINMFIYERIGLWLSPFLLIGAMLSTFRVYPWSRNYGRVMITVSIIASLASYFLGLALIRFAGERELPFYLTLLMFAGVIFIVSIPWLPRRATVVPA